jgi:hypothetical protein
VRAPLKILVWLQRAEKSRTVPQDVDCSSECHNCRAHHFVKTEIAPDFIRLFKGLINEMPVWQAKIGRENLRVFSTGQNSTPIGLEPFRNECRVLDFLGHIIDLL